ncbi:hypothetical protein XENTR_v10014407 [Xenopus tropicalis]|uniref:Receptor (chemosensory) transporter protein 3 gene D [provisional] n=1 Tax=Xenopus tropicalis TaxID=8364 RepID=A0A6I8R0U3_XENTR|nr:receptor-transporting protein 3 [Xenopus tropicalis]KAE8603655.1 hypothetical protein XENTR_v10014407 [Xenopus tropicalis]KAE8603656.1 hypothetical protein XENTR_v10014407 [Xenopus tropicalis]KAE8603657.1 hypothetical protein XENTR_v10014407 [Xenopus tropicalis]
MLGGQYSNWADVFQSVQETEIEPRHGQAWTLQIKNDLTDDLTSNQRQNGWKIYQSSSFGRFTCSNCRHGWNSARVSLTFHYRHISSAGGEVYLRTYRQKCRSCSSDQMLTAKFEQEKMAEVLMRVADKIRKNCYNEAIEQKNYIKFSKKTKPHEASLCEACMLGKCNRDADIY